MKGLLRIPLVVLALAGLSMDLPGDDCSSQNIFFPLGQGFTWSYQGVSGKLSISSEVTCTAIESGPASIAGELREVFQGYPARLTYTTLVRTDKGAVYSVEPTKQGDAPELNISAIVSDKLGHFQLYLPAVGQLGQGVGWSRSGGEVWSVDFPGGKMDQNGSYRQKNMTQVIGTETIAVPAGKFTTLKVQADYDIQSPGYSASYSFIRWYAPAVGLVKEMTADGSTVKELTAYHVTPCCGFVVTSVKGDARIDGNPAALGMGGSEEAHLEVPPGSAMDLALGDGSLLKLSEGVDARMKVFCPEKTLDRTVIDVIRGVIKSTVTKTFAPRSSPGIEFQTPTCIVGVRGTEFSLEVKEEEEGHFLTIIKVASGEVWVQSKRNGRETVLQAGTTQVFE